MQLAGRQAGWLPHGGAPAPTALLLPAATPAVMASGVTGSVSVALHPLVILNISDHWIRMRSQEGRPVQGTAHACAHTPSPPTLAAERGGWALVWGWALPRPG